MSTETEEAVVVAANAEPTAALVPSPGVSMGILRADRPGEFVAAAAELATALADIIRSRKLFSVIQGRDFVKVEGWTTLAVMLGVTPHELSVVEAPEGVFTATVELRRLADGAAVSRASAECGSPEEVDRYGKPLWGNRPRNARRSMALTRATGKACRLAFSWVMTLAGYEATPAEEMSQDEAQAPPRGPTGRVTAEQVAELELLIEAKAVDRGRFMDYVRTVTRGDESALDQIPAAKFSVIMDALKRKKGA